MEKIILWEASCENIRECERAIVEALRELGVKGNIVVNAEPPLISRNQLWGRLPVLEIRGQCWSLHPGKPFTRDQLVPLFRKLFIAETGTQKKGNRFMPDDTIISDENVAEKTADATGVLLFFKKVCPNCKALEKMLDKFYAANPDVNHWRIDSEESPETMKKFDVERVPTVVILKNGEIAARKVGLMNLREMTEFYRSA